VLVRLEETTSTNSVCAELAASGAPSGSAVIACRQTAGRGRLGRSWVTLPGDNLFLSVLHRSSRPPSELAGLTLDIGLAVISVIKHLGFRAKLDWPNDVYIGDLKVAGILCELHEDGHGPHVVIGVGLDIMADRMPPELEDVATSLLIEARRNHRTEDLDFERIAHMTLDGVRAAALAYETRGRPDIARWLEHSDIVGRRVRDTSHRTGKVTGLALDGALIIHWDGDSSPTPFIAGELLREPAPHRSQG